MELLRDCCGGGQPPGPAVGLRQLRSLSFSTMKVRLLAPPASARPAPSRAGCPACARFGRPRRAYAHTLQSLTGPYARLLV